MALSAAAAAAAAAANGKHHHHHGTMQEAADLTKNRKWHRLYAWAGGLAITGLQLMAMLLNTRTHVEIVCVYASVRYRDVLPVHTGCWSNGVWPLRAM
jgi:hypothetical protein